MSGVTSLETYPSPAPARQTNTDSRRQGASFPLRAPLLHALRPGVVNTHCFRLSMLLRVQIEAVFVVGFDLLDLQRMRPRKRILLDTRHLPRDSHPWGTTGNHKAAISG